MCLLFYANEWVWMVSTIRLSTGMVDTVTVPIAVYRFRRTEYYRPSSITHITLFNACMQDMIHTSVFCNLT